MFATAYEIASKFTHPVLISYRFFDGTVESGLGSFVILNKEGWILTAAHILDPALAGQQHSLEIKKYNEEINKIKNDNNLNAKEKEKRIRKVIPNKKWITNHSHWWGADNHRINNFLLLPQNDLAVGKIENFDPNFAKGYPIIKSKKDLKNGTSLCKLGHPFYEVKATFNLENNSFNFDPSIFPIPRFPIEGIFTRNIYGGKTPDGQFDIKFIETSSPGLRGQSGGPIFDTKGQIWGIQSRTQHLPLGFSPKIKKGNIEVEENQFLNVGWGIHLETIIDFLTKNNISFQMSNDQ